MADAFRVPVHVAGIEVGYAEVSRDGEFITAELNPGIVPDNIRAMLFEGFATALSIDLVTQPAVPEPLSQEEKSSRWHQERTPFWMG